MARRKPNYPDEEHQDMAMTRRERLIATMAGKPVDRPAVSFYEITGFDQKSDDPDPFNIYNDPSWRPLLELAREKTDLIVMRGVPFTGEPPDPLAEYTEVDSRDNGIGMETTRTIRYREHTFRSRSRRDRDVNTIWETEPLLKSADDLRAWLTLPQRPPGGAPDIRAFLAAEAEVGDDGIVMIDTGDPLCMAAPLFDLGEFTVVAAMERDLFGALLDRCSAWLLPRIEAVAAALPGRLWRIYGPEYASSPYLPPALFREYVVKYDTPIIDAIQKSSGFARIHSHGNLRGIIDDIAATGCSGLDPIEPPPQGDMQLWEVRERCGDQMVLFGNLECSDIESLPVREFEEKVKRALDEGPGGSGFVLMPSACPYGRKLSATALVNYEAMVRAVEAL
jgi:hypothetical protein